MNAMWSPLATLGIARVWTCALAPRITVNGLALGPILPPEDQPFPPNLLDLVPEGRWATLEEVGQALVFLLAGPEYITGEIIHIDGGRHLI